MEEDRGTRNRNRYPSGQDGRPETVVLYHRRYGDYVAIENQGVSDIRAFNIEAYKEAVRDDDDAGKYSYWRNQNKTDNIFWVHRQWVEDRMEEWGGFTDG